MEKFDNPFSKLLYTVYRLKSTNQISDTDKYKLKSMIILGDSSIHSILSHYLDHQNPERLNQDIIKLIHPIRSKPEPIIATRTKEDEEVSSPLGKFLHERKKHQTSEPEFKLSLQNADMPTIEEIHLFKA